MDRVPSNLRPQLCLLQCITWLVTIHYSYDNEIHSVMLKTLVYGLQNAFNATSGIFYNIPLIATLENQIMLRIMDFLVTTLFPSWRLFGGQVLPAGVIWRREGSERSNGELQKREDWREQGCPRCKAVIMWPSGRLMEGLEPCDLLCACVSVANGQGSGSSFTNHSLHLYNSVSCLHLNCVQMCERLC